jgi:hypothetical protein
MNMKLMCGLAVSLLCAIPIPSAELPRERQPLVVHEWGTFTSVASETGNPVRWAPLAGPADLPCFVAKLGPPNFKDIARGFVRMETPVLYFYSKTPVTLSVRVAFPEGWITEWYPNASQVSPNKLDGTAPTRYTNGEIRWDDVRVLPGETPDLPVTAAASHYFAARETDSAPIRVGTQWEKLIFYRGVGEFSVPLRPVITAEGRVRITNAGQETVPGYRIAAGLKTTAELDFPELTSDIDELPSALVSHLVEFGLYPKEAKAMVKTWRDSWFEEGMRLFYIVPREMVDRVLPLEVRPAASATARVFVGRIELLSPATRERIESSAAANDVEALKALGRFLGPFVTQMERTNPGHHRPAAIQAVFQSPLTSSACVK